MTLSSNIDNVQESSTKYDKICGEILACNSIKYAAYRTASKLFVLQNSLGFFKINLQIIKGVLEKHHLQSTDNYLILSNEEIENILHDLFYAVYTLEDKKNIGLFVDMTKLLLHDIFLKNGASNRISVFDFKVIITCLCSSSLLSKYLYWFSQLMDHNLCLPRRRFHTLLHSLLQITNYLSESATFSVDLIQPTLDSCYIEEHHIELGISENEFVNWLTKEPQLLVWLSTFYRLSVSQKVTHKVECSVCGMYPIVGLRYHCLRCIRYDLCQLCFFTGRSSKRHRPRHLIKEYCSQTSFYETTSTFFKEVFKRLCGNQAKLQYLPVNSNFICKSTCTGNTFPVKPEESSKTSGIKLDDGELRLRNELRGIILDMEKKAKTLLAEDCDAKHLINQQVQFFEKCLQQIKALKVEEHLKEDAKSNTSIATSNTSNNFLSMTEKESTICIPSISGFSTWIEEAQHETTYTRQLQNDLDNIMAKLNNMLELNFSISQDE